MAGSKYQKQKLLLLAKILEKKTDEDHPMTADELVGELQKEGIVCERKSVYGDINALKDAGYDILKTRSCKSGFYLVSRDWEPAEIRLLTDAVLAANFITRKKSKEMAEKLRNMLSIYQAEEIDRQVYIDNRRKEKNEEIYYSTDMIQTAISKKQKIKFKYIRRRINEKGEMDSNTKDFVISPYALLWLDDRYYLIGNNEKYENLMHLRVDRMKSVQIINERVRPFEEVSDYKNFFDAADYASKLSNAFGGEVEPIEITCKNEMLEAVLDRFGEEISIREQNETCFTFKTTAAISDGLVADIIKFGSSIEVKKPKHLRQMVAKAVSDLWKIYKIDMVNIK